MWVQQKDYKIVGSVLRAAREAADLRQLELAKRLAKPQSFISSYESGQRRIDVLELLRIATCIGTDPVALFAAIADRSPALKPRAAKR